MLLIRRILSRRKKGKGIKMGNRYIKDALEKRIWGLGHKDTGDYINEVLEREVKKEEEKKK